MAGKNKLRVSPNDVWFTVWHIDNMQEALNKMKAEINKLAQQSFRSKPFPSYTTDATHGASYATHVEHGGTDPIAEWGDCIMDKPESPVTANETQEASRKRRREVYDRLAGYMNTLKGEREMLIEHFVGDENEPLDNPLASK